MEIGKPGHRLYGLTECHYQHFFYWGTGWEGWWMDVQQNCPVQSTLERPNLGLGRKIVLRHIWGWIGFRRALVPCGAPGAAVLGRS